MILAGIGMIISSEGAIGQLLSKWGGAALAGTAICLISQWYREEPMHTPLIVLGFAWLGMGFFLCILF